VLGAKGLAGAFRIESLTDVPGRIVVGASLFLEGEEHPRRVTDVQAGGRVPVVALEGISDRDAAEALAGRYLEVAAEPLPDGSWYWHEIVGLQVVDEGGTPLGSVVEVFRAGENEVYRIDGPGGELLVPSLRDVVREVDVAAGRMIVRWEPEEVR
jgi:16S rRNA processing protein RimM